MNGLNYNVVNFSLVNSRSLRIKYISSFHCLLDRNYVTPILTGKSSRGILLSDLTWKWTAGRHIRKAFLHNETELWTLAGHLPLEEVTGYLSLGVT